MEMTKNTDSLKRELALFLIASAFLGIATGIDSSFFNNYLSDVFHITVAQRTILEIPRELPGFLVVFVSGALIAFGDVRTAAIANILGAIGAMGLGFMSPSYAVMVGWLTTYSMGQHLFIPMSNSIGMSLGTKDTIGKVLGRINAWNTAAFLLTSVAVAGVMTLVKIPYSAAFGISAAAYTGAAAAIFLMHPNKPKKPKKAIIVKRKFSLYYILCLLFGARKQIFITFGPWVLIKIFQQGVSTFAVLSFITALSGIFFKPFVGGLIDKKGEKFVLIAEAVMLVIVCLGYAVSEALFGKGQLALLIIAACFIFDQLLAAAGMARATYVKKISSSDDEVSPTLAMGTTVDHIMSMSIPLLGNIVWIAFGYQYVFVGGMIIAALNIFFASRIKIQSAS